MPELELFGWTTTSSATDSRLTRHRHENAFEICFIARGSVYWWVNDESYRLKRGSVYLTKPDELHGGIDGVMHPCELYWFILPDPADRPFPGLTSRQTQHITDSLRAIDGRTFPSSPSLQACFVRLREELDDPDVMSLISARGLLHQLLVELLRDHDKARASPGEGAPSKQIDRTLAWLTRHLGEEISVNDMAKIAGMSVSRFHERFLEELGLTPSEYLSWARILRAKELLVESTSTVSTIGFDLGFSSSQYFATVFKKLVGMSPMDYRAAQRRAG